MNLVRTMTKNAITAITSQMSQLKVLLLVTVIIVPPMQGGTLDRIVNLLGYHRRMVLGIDMVLGGLGIGIGSKMAGIKLKISRGCGSNRGW